jgi:signal peptidase II
MKLNLFIFFFVVLIDQVSKRYLLSSIDLGDSKEFLPGVMSLTMAQNTGGAFSVFKEYPMLFMIIGIVNLLIFSYVCFCPNVKLSNSMKTGCAFILGGTLGNLIDRVTNGAVIDFFNLEFVDFAIFNFADVAINVGVVIILAGLFPVRKKQLIKGN